jgi:sec-independent protein translocase protein TatC
MILPKLLRLRDKITNKRKQLAMDEEKPFLEHLEDLRKMITRIVITLVVSMMVSMIWYQEFLEIVQYPASKAGLLIAEDKNRPEKFDHQRWELVKETARVSHLLTDAQREQFLGTVAAKDPALRLETEALTVYRAAWQFAKTKSPDKKDRVPEAAEIAVRDQFIQAMVGSKPEMLAAVQEMVKLNTPADLEPAKAPIELVWRKPAESFFTAMKLALYAGFMLSFPLVFYFLLEFILPGLTSREKRLLWPALAVGFGLFLTGMLFAFFWVVPRTLEFFHAWSGEIAGTQDLWTFADYTSFVTVFSLVFGASFELPVVVLVLVKLGLLTSEFMRRTRSWAIVIIIVVAAVITPTGDPGTLAALAVPMIVMYEACIWIALWMETRAKRLEEAEEKESIQRHAERSLGLPAAEAGRAESTSEDGPAPVAPQPVLHPDIQPYRNPHEDAYHDHDYHNQHYHDHPQHQDDMDHDAWLKEQEEIYRREHAHLFGDKPLEGEAGELVESATEAAAEALEQSEPAEPVNEPNEQPQGMAQEPEPADAETESQESKEPSPDQPAKPNPESPTKDT